MKVTEKLYYFLVVFLGQWWVPLELAVEVVEKMSNFLVVYLGQWMELLELVVVVDVLGLHVVFHHEGGFKDGVPRKRGSNPRGSPASCLDTAISAS